MSRLDWLNHLPIHQASEELLKCCGSKSWSTKMSEDLPYRDFDDLIRTSEKVWLSLPPSDWLEAFSQHPRIGEKKNLGKWTSQEQKGVEGAQEHVVQELAELNVKYEQKFGHVFLVCATGKSADEMLEILKTRINHSASQELQIAAKEQMKITEIRLRKLLHL